MVWEQEKKKRRSALDRRGQEYETTSKKISAVAPNSCQKTEFEQPFDKYGWKSKLEKNEQCEK